MALTPTSALYTPVILSALATGLARNSTTPLGRQLSISPTYITNSVTQDSAPYTCKLKKNIFFGNDYINVICSSLCISICIGCG